MADEQPIEAFVRNRLVRADPQDRLAQLRTVCGTYGTEKLWSFAMLSIIDHPDWMQFGLPYIVHGPSPFRPVALRFVDSVHCQQTLRHMTQIPTGLLLLLVDY